MILHRHNMLSAKTCQVTDVCRLQAHAFIPSNSSKASRVTASRFCFVLFCFFVPISRVVSLYPTSLYIHQWCARFSLSSSWDFPETISASHCTYLFVDNWTPKLFHSHWDTGKLKVNRFAHLPLTLKKKLVDLLKQVFTTWSSCIFWNKQISH